MKSILAYGDSLTFGANPIKDGPRHAYEDRWPSTLEAGLGGKARVIAEGLGGRTTMFDDWATNADRNGARILPTLLQSHAPLDLVVIMLGTNDLKPSICGSAQEASYGMRRLVQIVRGHFGGLSEPVPQVLLVAPPHIVDTGNEDMASHFGGIAHGIEQSQQFATHYAKRAEELGVQWFDAATVATAHSADGVHLDPQNTRAIGEGLVPVVKSLLSL
jgi:lysophospholipase L1-like esterase